MLLLFERSYLFIQNMNHFVIPNEYRKKMKREKKERKKEKSI